MKARNALQSAQPWSCPPSRYQMPIRSSAPRNRYTSRAARCDCQVPLGFDHKSASPSVERSALGATSAFRECWSKGNSCSLPTNSQSRGPYQYGIMPLAVRDGFGLRALPAEATRATRAGPVGCSQRYALVGCASEQGGFAASRVPDDGDAVAPDGVEGEQEVDAAMVSPCPRRQSSNWPSG